MDARAAEMAWDWDAADIDPDEDDGQIWVPVTPKTLEEYVEKPQGTPKTPESKQPTGLRNMAVYTISNGPEGAVQGDAPLRQEVLSPQVPGPVVVLDAGESSDLTELSETEAREDAEGRAAGPKAVTVVRAAGAGRKGPVPKHAPVVTLTTPRGTSCDRCRRMGRTCFSRRKGGQILGACARCYEAKTACKTGRPDASDAGSDNGQWSGSHKSDSRTGGKRKDGPVTRSPRLAAVRARARLETYRT